MAADRVAFLALAGYAVLLMWLGAVALLLEPAERPVVMRQILHRLYHAVSIMA